MLIYLQQFHHLMTSPTLYYLQAPAALIFLKLSQLTAMSARAINKEEEQLQVISKECIIYKVSLDSEQSR